MKLSMRTITGRRSSTKLLARISIILQGTNIAFCQAFGLDADTALIVSSSLAMLHGVVADELRDRTSEPMR